MIKLNEIGDSKSITKTLKGNISEHNDSNHCYQHNNSGLSVKIINVQKL